MDASIKHSSLKNVLIAARYCKKVCSICRLYMIQTLVKFICLVFRYGCPCYGDN